MIGMTIAAIFALPFALATAPVAGGAAVVTHSAGLLVTTHTLAVSGSVATATVISGSATAVFGALGTLLGAKFDRCKTDQERLAVIL
jgi:hypothetical protein